MSSRIIMQLCEDSLTFNNFRSWYSIQTARKEKHKGHKSCEQKKQDIPTIVEE